MEGSYNFQRFNLQPSKIQTYKQVKELHKIETKQQKALEMAAKMLLKFYTFFVCCILILKARSRQRLELT